MSKLDLTKNFAIVSLGVAATQNQKYGVAFAVFRSNTDLFLVSIATNKTSVSLLEINRNNLTFIHPKHWEELFETNNNNIIEAYRGAYLSTPEDWPCGFVRAQFSGQSPSSDKVTTKA